MAINVFETKDLPTLTEQQKVAYFGLQLFVGSHPYADDLGYLHFHDYQSMQDFQQTKFYKDFLERNKRP